MLMIFFWTGRLRASQLQVLAEVINPLLAAGRVVILGGDYNQHVSTLNGASVEFLALAPPGEATHDHGISLDNVLIGADQEASGLLLSGHGEVVRWEYAGGKTVSDHRGLICEIQRHGTPKPRHDSPLPVRGRRVSKREEDEKE